MARRKPQAIGREQAWQLLTEWTQSESLRKHALAVEACVVACGEAGGGPARASTAMRAPRLVELYSTTALLHDFDYERHPTAEEHPFVGVRELERLGWPEELRTAILGHAQYSGVPRHRISPRPSSPATSWPASSPPARWSSRPKPIADVEVPSVKKKMKDKAFARGVHREDIVQGAAELGVDLDAHIAFCIEAMKKRAAELGL